MANWIRAFLAGFREGVQPRDRGVEYLANVHVFRGDNGWHWRFTIIRDQADDVVEEQTVAHRRWDDAHAEAMMRVDRKVRSLQLEVRR